MSRSQQRRLKGVAREIVECDILEAKWRKFQIGDSIQGLKAYDWSSKVSKENWTLDLAKWKLLVTLIRAFSAECWGRKLHWHEFKREQEERSWSSGYRSLFQGILPWSEGEKKWILGEFGSGIKRGFVCFIEDEKITACLPADGNDPGGIEKLIQKKEAELLEQSQWMAKSR